MEEFSLTEWLAKAKQEPKMAAQPVVVLLAIVFFGWKFFYSPKKVLLEKERKKQKDVQGQMRELETAVENKEELKLEVEELKKKQAELEKICYKKNEAPIFLQDLRKLAKEAGLDIKSINPMPMIPKTFESLVYEEYPVRIAFSGDLAQLGIFLRTMENHPRLIFLDLPPLVPDASGAFKFDLNPTAFVVPEEQPHPAETPPPEG